MKRAKSILCGRGDTLLSLAGKVFSFSKSQGSSPLQSIVRPVNLVQLNIVQRSLHRPDVHPYRKGVIVILYPETLIAKRSEGLAAIRSVTIQKSLRCLFFV